MLGKNNHSQAFIDADGFMDDGSGRGINDGHQQCTSPGQKSLHCRHTSNGLLWGRSTSRGRSRTSAISGRQRRVTIVWH